MPPAAAVPADTETPPPPTAVAPAPRLPRPRGRRPAAIHRKTRAPVLPPVVPCPSPSPGDRAAPSASRAAWWESPAAAVTHSAHSALPAPGVGQTPAPFWLTLPQTVARHRSWPPPARPPRLAVLGHAL